MGAITYDDMVVEFDDRTLAHLQVVIVQRFTAGRSVLLSWLDALATGDGRSSMWLTPHAPLHFKFVGSRSPAIDRAWLDRLFEAASSGAGLVVVDAEGAFVRAEHQQHVNGHRP